jgi:hypothetical protein
MSADAWTDRFRPHSVPTCLFVLVTLSILLVPPLVLGEATFRTYAITTAVVLLAASSVFPYAIVVAVVTLPLVSTGIASYASPDVLPAESGSLSVPAALRHVVAGIAYVLAAAAVGGIGIGVDFAVSSGSSPLPAALRPSFLFVGGVLVGGTFLTLQLWRYEGPADRLDRRAVFGTAALGVLLAVSPAVALWVFNSSLI